MQQHTDDRERRGDRAGRAGQPEQVVDPQLLQRPGGEGAAHGGQDGPVTLVITTSHQRRERRWPLGSSRAGSVTPSAIAGPSQAPDAATTLATSGRDRCSRMSWSIQGSRGTVDAQARPAAPYSQPIGFSGRRRASTSPTVAVPSTKKNA